eukprot:2852085-Rhodomonas_salina.4
MAEWEVKLFPSAVSMQQSLDGLPEVEEAGLLTSCRDGVALGHPQRFSTTPPGQHSQDDFHLGKRALRRPGEHCCGQGGRHRVLLAGGGHHLSQLHLPGPVL